MRPDPGLLLPRRADEYRGTRWAIGVLVLYAVLATARSLVHVLAPDSGAGSIATIDTGAAGGDNAVALLGQWGGAQLVLALLVWVVLARYRGLVPLVLAAVLLEALLRLLVGRLKPLETLGTPPGAPGTWVLLVVAAAALVASLVPREPAG
ncbi:hypothetical protein JKP75_09945 [Blastococcus sp. TML/M2B]|uniref:hypothetical protein n=1 Tax=unclassified Blastococcus TaxID=2619396 RepID=UPI00190B88F2|nr:MULTISPECIES: hypothetical protein [unclassified Blastococcus]MBN1092851.1 hypothetical protein [Blastococcus sp. TML/M2B]MBN1097038.1 hypothetical protein [Blastococcus sp. TML/C7B]